MGGRIQMSGLRLDVHAGVGNPKAPEAAEVFALQIKSFGAPVAESAGQHRLPEVRHPCFRHIQNAAGRGKKTSINNIQRGRRIPAGR